MKVRINSLHNLIGLEVKVNVISPVPTPCGPIQIDHDDDVEIEIEAGDVTVCATIKAEDYLDLIKARSRQNANG